MAVRRWGAQLTRLFWIVLLLLPARPLAAQGGAGSLPLLPPGVHVGIVYADPQPGAANPLDEAFSQTIAAGVDVYQLSLYWSQLEPEPGVVDTSLLDQFLATLDSIGLIPYLVIPTIDTVRLALPPDLVDPADPAALAGGRFDDPALLARWGTVLDAVVPRLAEHGGFFLSVGNEVDVWLAAHPEEVAPFMAFLVFSRARVQALAPRMGVGATVTFNGLNAGRTFIADVLAGGDAAAFTYYPLNADYTVRDPASVGADVDQMIQAAGGLPVLIQEAGYPSGYRPEASNGSSDEMQRQFIAGLFQAIDARTQVRMVSVFQLADWPDAACDYFLGYYGTDAPRFREYLCSLGLYTADGQAKPAFQAFLTGLSLVR